MNIFLKRNIKLYFRDRTNFLISLLAIVIVIALYALFLGNVWGYAEIMELTEIEILRDSWLTAGILAVATITTSMGAFAVIVDDRTKKINKGFYASPVKRSHITGGYIFSAFSIGVIMTIITAIPLGIYIVARGGQPLTLTAYLQTIGIILLSSLSSTAIVCFIISFLKSHSAFTTASTIVGTLVGFLMGIYLPIGILPEAVQTVMKLFPPSHAAALLRQTIMDGQMQRTFENIPAEHLEYFQEIMGVTFQFGDFEITPFISIMVLLASGVIFYGLSLVNMRKISK